MDADAFRIRRWLLIALIAGAAVVSIGYLQLLPFQAPGIDFFPLWAGAKTALTDPSRLYDFQHISTLQDWPLGPGKERPFVYPPSALLVLLPFALPPRGVGYALWVLGALALFVVAGRKAGAPWWFVLLPAMALAAYCGQVTFLIGCLVVAGLVWRHRPLVAGLLFGLAAAIKPQLLILLPVALAAGRDWKAMATTFICGATLCAISAMVWGLGPWLEWFGALGRFQAVVFTDPELVADAITPYALLTRLGLNGAFAWLLAPLVLAAVWFVFRKKHDFADQTIALFGGALLLSPYAMHYEAALFAPAVATYLARYKEKAWPAYAAAGLLYILGIPALVLPAVLALPTARLALRDSLRS